MELIAARECQVHVTQMLQWGDTLIGKLWEDSSSNSQEEERENLVVLVDNLDFFLPAMQDHCTG